MMWVDLPAVLGLVYRVSQAYLGCMARDNHSLRQTFHRGSSALAR